MVSRTLPERSSLKPTDTDLISKMRVGLAFSTLLVIYIDPSEPQRFVALTYATLILYSVYSLVVFFSNRRKNTIPSKTAHWIDVLWFSVLIALSYGIFSIFFFLFYFAIMEAAFRFGYWEGIKTTVISAVVYMSLGYLTAPENGVFELNRFLLRGIYLGFFGYMISYWGGKELTYIKQLAVLKDINKLSNPRFGIDQTLASILKKILQFYDAGECLLITFDSSENKYCLRQSSRENTDQAVRGEEIRRDDSLIKVPGEDVVIFKRLHSAVFKNEQNSETGEMLADLLNTDSLISVPFFQQEKLTGRIYLTSQQKSFDGADAEFLAQLLAQIIPMIDNINLLDKLASEATALQRQKISRDIHDSTVQPYIGIKFGLEALQIKHDSGENISNEIARLVEMANTNIEEIRGYIDRLKDDQPDALKGSALVSAIRQQARKISEFYGIEIEVLADNEIRVSDRLSAEIYQIVSEGLSNIKRHTDSIRAFISIQSDDKNLKLEIRNEFSASNGAVRFTPKSIAGRAEAIGGQALVETENDTTKVSVVIPL